MENKFTKIKNWIPASFQLITVGLLVFAIILIWKQQNDIRALKSRINDVDYNIDDIESKLDDVESNLSSEIDDVKRTVRIWSN
jgi:cell division protein FtsL